MLPGPITECTVQSCTPRWKPPKWLLRLSILVLFAILWTIAAQAQNYTISGYIFSDPTHSGGFSGQGYALGYPTTYVKLLTYGGAFAGQVATIAPGSSGAYSFSAPGNAGYIVALSSNGNSDNSGLSCPAGYWATLGSQQCQVQPAWLTGNIAGVNIGLAPTSLAGTAYIDANDNGGFDAGETWTGPTIYVKLLTNTGAYAGFVATIATGSSGAYTFTAVPFGSYTIALATNGNADNTGLGYLPYYYGTQNPSGKFNPAAIGYGNTNQTNGNFGVIHMVVSGTVYIDTNKNSNLDAGEAWTAQTPVWVKLLTIGGAYAGQVQKIMPGSSGAYSFEVAPGSYAVALSTNGNADNTGLAYPAGYYGTQNNSTPPEISCYSVGVWVQAINKNFGVAANVATYSASGTVYYDADGSGTLNNGEKWTGTVNAYIKLLNSDGSYAGQVVTIPPGASGAYTLTAIVPGTYTLALATNGNADNTGLGFPTGYAGTAPAAPSISITITNANIVNKNFGLTTSGSSIPGMVFNDTNHNGLVDSGESGYTGATQLYAKLVASGGSSAISATAVGATGSFSIPVTSTGTYTVLVSTNSTLADITSTYPVGWLPTQSPAGQVTVQVTSLSGAMPAANLALFNGVTFSGMVFNDNGSGTGGIADDGHWNGSEPGIANATLIARDSTSVVLDQEYSSSAGTYVMWLPATANVPVTITLSQISGFSATGFDSGTPVTGGTYNRTSQVLSFIPNFGGSSYTGVNFGFLQTGNTFSPNGEKTIPPGAIAIYPHVYSSLNAGTVTFTMTPAQSQPNYFSEVLYWDKTCSGNLSSATLIGSGSSVSTPVPITVTGTAGQVCIVLKEMANAATSFGMQNNVTIAAAFTYAGSSATNTLTVFDLSTVDNGNSGALQLVKSAYIDAACTNPATPAYSTSVLSVQSGYCIKYQIQATNSGASALSGLTINDAVPAFTALQSATPAAAVGTNCGSLTVPASIGVSAGDLQAVFTGTMPAGCVATLVYEVKLN